MSAVEEPTASGIVPGTDVKCEGTKSSTKVRDRDVSEAVALPPSKAKVVHIDPKPPTVIEYREEHPIISFSPMPMISSNMLPQTYKWTSCYFREPTKSAMKRTVGQLPKDSSVPPHALISPVPSRMLPATSISMEKPVHYHQCHQVQWHQHSQT